MNVTLPANTCPPSCNDCRLRKTGAFTGVTPEVLAFIEGFRADTRAVEAGGSTLRDFSNAKGESGHFQLEAMVYGRQGQPCKVCGTEIRMIRQGQRSTFFCANCQKP